VLLKSIPHGSSDVWGVSNVPKYLHVPDLLYGIDCIASNKIFTFFLEKSQLSIDIEDSATYSFGQTCEIPYST
jgi:hypothetical protein